MDIAENIGPLDERDADTRIGWAPRPEPFTRECVYILTEEWHDGPVVIAACRSSAVAWEGARDRVLRYHGIAFADFAEPGEPEETEARAWMQRYNLAYDASIDRPVYSVTGVLLS